jgi:hypothetical protein
LLVESGDDNLAGNHISKVASLVWARLMANKDIIHKWQEVCFPTSSDMCATARTLFMVLPISLTR